MDTNLKHLALKLLHTSYDALSDSDRRKKDGRSYASVLDGERRSLNSRTIRNRTRRKPRVERRWILSQGMCVMLNTSSVLGGLVVSFNPTQPEIPYDRERSYRGSSGMMLSGNLTPSFHAISPYSPA